MAAAQEEGSLVAVLRAQRTAREEGEGEAMSSAAKVRFAELMGSARSAIGEVASAPAEVDSEAVMRAASAASRAAGFIEGVTASDPFTAREMVAEFESLVHEAEEQAAEPGEAEASSD